MKKIIKSRNSGKTTQLIKISAGTGHHIVCKDGRTVNMIVERAKELKLNIPTPITYYEFIYRKYSGKEISGFLIDDADMLIQCLTPIKVEAITLSVHML